MHSSPAGRGAAAHFRANTPDRHERPRQIDDVGDPHDIFPLRPGVLIAGTPDMDRLSFFQPGERSRQTGNMSPAAADAQKTARAMARAMVALAAA